MAADAVSEAFGSAQTLAAGADGPLEVVKETILRYGAVFDEKFEAALGPVHSASAGFPLMKPHNALAMVLGYLAFVIFVPLLFRTVGFSMKLKPIMRLYNLFMVILSGYMGTKSILLARETNNSLFCVPMASGQAREEMAQLVWIFTYSKVVEFLDTFFMIMEGRMRQVSFLHVYHHCSILSYWFCILWMMPGSDAYFSLAGNSYIHVLMYSYYFLASFGYSPPWKYYITKAQIFQFCCFCVQSIYVGYMNDGKCDFPIPLARGLLWYMLTLIALFMHFLVTNKGKAKRTQSVKNTHSVKKTE